MRWRQRYTERLGLRKPAASAGRPGGGAMCYADGGGTDGKAAGYDSIKAASTGESPAM